MRNFKFILITSILALAIVCSLAGCLSNSANASPVIDDEIVEENKDIWSICFITLSSQASWATDYALSDVNPTNFDSPDAKSMPGYDFKGWYFTQDFEGVDVGRMTTEKFKNEVKERHPNYEGGTLVFNLYAKWIKQGYKEISTAEDLVEIYDVYLAEIDRIILESKIQHETDKDIKVKTEDEARREANNLVFVLTSDIDLSDFKHHEHADEKTLNPDDFDSEAEMEAERVRLYGADGKGGLYANSWVPIAGGVGECFGATFDGAGYEIKGMEIVVTKYDADPEFHHVPIGLFGKVSGTVKNVNLVDYHIQMDGDASRFYVGGVVGWNSFYDYENEGDTSPTQYGVVENCSSSGEIINLEIEYTGNMWDSLFGSYAEPTTNVYFGGVIGYLEEATANKISSNGVIDSKSVADAVYLGGVVGYNLKGRITSSNANVEVYGRYAGGLVGYNNGTISRSYALGKASGSESYPAVAGGLVAYNFTEGVIERCYAEGAVNARTAGGLVGINVFDYATAGGGTIRNAYAMGNVKASEYAGGLVGRATADLPIFGREDFHPSIFDDDKEYSSDSAKNTYAIIEHCFAYGDVEANASETEFKDEKGNVIQGHVYYSVFAGALFGQSYEQLVHACVAFGDVEAISNRPKNSDDPDDLTYNTAFAGNFAGQTTNSVIGADYRNVYAIDGISVMRNGEDFSGKYIVDGEEEQNTYPNTTETRTYAWLNDQDNLEDANGMAFDRNLWNLSNLDIENGVYPTLVGV